MNVFKRVLTLLLVGVGAITLTACKPDDEPEPVTSYNALGGWVDGGDGVYTIETNTDSELSFSYAKGTLTFPYMEKDVSDQAMSDFRKLVVTVEGTGTMLLKLEASDGTYRQISLNVTGISGSYEWNLINDGEFLSDLSKIYIFGSPGKTDSIGSITITTLEFSVDVAQNYIIQTDFDNIPQNVNEYDGTTTEFDFNAKWEGLDANIYDVEYQEDGTHVSFDKSAGFEWAALKSAVQGDFTDFNYIVLEVSGTAGQKFLAKPSEYNAFEGFIFLTAEPQELILDISGMTDEEKNSITEIYVFGSAGLASSGSFVIHQAFFAEDYDYEPPVIDKNIYTSGLTFNLEYWYDGGDMNYTIETDGTDVIIDYNKTGEWTYAIAHIEGDLSNFASVDIVVTGQANKTALLKIEGPDGNIEESVTFDGTEQTFTIDLTQMTPAQLSVINKFLIFAAPGSNLGTGTFTIHSVTFGKEGFSFNDQWEEVDAGTYAITNTDGVVSVDYTKGVGQEWSHMKVDFTDEDVSAYNTMTLVLDGTSGKTVLVKPNDSGALEQLVTFGDDPVTVTVTADSFTNVIVFAEPGTASVNGSFQVLEATLSYVFIPEVDITNIFDFTTGDFMENDAGTYTFTEVDGTTVVDYTKGTGQEWVFGKIQFNNYDVPGLNTMTLVLDGTAGKQVLLKPNDDGALEQWVTFGAEPVTVTITADSFQNLIFFAEAGTADVTGQFTILSATISYVYQATNYVDGGDGAYTIDVTDGIVTVDYNKGVGLEWTFFRINFNPEDVGGLNTLMITLDGTAGKQVLVKPNDSSALEQWVTFGAEPVTIKVTADSFTTIILFAEAGTASVSGQFTILETALYYVAPAVDVTTTVDFTTGDFVSGDAGVYTYTISGDTTVVDYAKGAGQEWSFGKIDFDDTSAGLNTLTLTLHGTYGKQVLLKPNDDGALEQWVTFGTQPVTVVITADSFQNLIFFAEAGTASVSGQFTILSATLSYTFSTTDYIDNGDGAYTITVTDGVVTVDYNKTDLPWTYLRVNFDPELTAGLNTLTMTLDGTAGKQVLVKPNDSGAMEQWVTFGAQPVTVTFSATSFTTIIVFAEGGTGTVSGQFTILETILSYTEPS